MSTFRIALANLRFPATPDVSVTLAEDAIAQAGIQRADICFRECFVPRYRGMGKTPPSRRSVPRTRVVLRRSGGREGHVTVVFVTERVVACALLGIGSWGAGQKRGV
jgi:hypothetical protein